MLTMLKTKYLEINCPTNYGKKPFGDIENSRSPLFNLSCEKGMSDLNRDDFKTKFIIFNLISS
jgi:hypothetical protein